MTKGVARFIEKIDLEEFKEFEQKTNSSFEHKKTTENTSRDFSWIPVIEEAIPYLDNIIRNPKRFLEQEEDIVIVEKSKKISTETITHLAQHTNYIQDVDEYGMIKPSKVLNIEKEDTWDLYENRFIYTLIKELVKFIRKYTDSDLDKPSFIITNTANYTAEADYNNENIKITVNLETTKNEEPKSFDIESMRERMINIFNIIADYDNSNFIKSLSQALPVKSPIKKTNTILNDPNFKKALDVWEYIKNSEIGIEEPKSIKETEILTKNSTKDKFDLTFFMDYLSLAKDLNDDEEYTDLLIDKLITLLDNYIDLSDISEKRLTTFITKEIEGAIKKRKNRDSEIEKIYENFIQIQNEQLEYIYDMI